MVLQERKSAMTAISTNATINSISQGHLNTWETCKRKYQYSFLEDLSSDMQTRFQETFSSVYSQFLLYLV